MQNTAGGGGGGANPYTPTALQFLAIRTLRRMFSDKAFPRALGRSEALVTRMPEPRVSGCSDFQGIPLTNYIAEFFSVLVWAQFHQ